jgi:hypothetical protein
LMIFLWFYWELCILFLDPFLYGFFFVSIIHGNFSINLGHH